MIYARTPSSAAAPDAPVRVLRPFSGGLDPAVRDGIQRVGEQVTHAYRERFGWNGWDGAGATLDIAVESREAGSISWDSGRIHADRRTTYEGRDLPCPALDFETVAHEYAHGILNASGYHVEVPRAHGRPAVRPERQVVHESFADVLSVSFGHDWLWGNDGMPAGDSLIRDLAHPTYATMRDIRRVGANEVETHIASETLSSAAVRVADVIGREAMRDIWFAAATRFLDPRSGPAGAGRAVQRAADSLHGAGSAPSVAVRDAWAAIGLNTRY